jgi:hypothetical protein
MTINKKKINAIVSAVQSGRTSPTTGLKIIGAELKEGIFPVKSGKTETVNKARGGLVKKKKTKKKKK